MAAAGTEYNRSFTSSASVDEATQALVTGMAGVKGYSIAVTPPSTIIVTRTYRPGWAIALAVVTSLLFLVGLLFLLITRTEALTITVAADGRRSRLSVAGIGAYELIMRLNASLRSLPDLRDPTGTPAEVKDPVVAEAVSIIGGQKVPGPPSAPPAPVSAPAAAAAAPLAMTAADGHSAYDAVAPADGPACTGCGALLASDDQFCGRCGAAAPVVEPDPTCDNCQAVLYDGDAFCTACGQAIAPA